MINDFDNYEPHFGFFWNLDEALEHCDEELENLTDESDDIIFYFISYEKIKKAPRPR